MIGRISWMRDPVKMNTPAIRTGLEEFCAYAAGVLTPMSTVWEVGAFAGESAEVFAGFFAWVHSVDDWSDPCGSPFTAKRIEASFDRVAKRHPNVTKHRGRSIEVAAGVDSGSADLVYIDGSHEYPCVLADLATWWPKLRSGGIMAGHDCGFPAVMQAIGNFFALVLGRPAAQVRRWPDTSWSLVKEGER